MIDPYINPQTGRRWKLTATEREIIAQDKVTSKALLAMQYGVNPRQIDFIQNPDKYYTNNEYTKAYRKKQRLLAVPKKKKKTPPRPLPTNPYEEKIHTAIASGMGVYDIDTKISESLTQLLRNKWDIELQIEEVRKTQDALYRMLNPEPIILSAPDLVLRETEKIIYLTPKEMIDLMTECGLTLKKLAEEMKSKYSVRALQAYRTGQSPVPRDVSELLRGFPRKSHLKMV